MTPDEFREKLRDGSHDYLIDEVIMARPAMHLSEEQIAHIESALTRRFRNAVPAEAVITGSAKLGFATRPKNRTDEPPLPSYRLFSGASDIDVAVISPEIFNAVWHDLSTHAHAAARRMPWNSDVLGDYLVHGWLRPDKFPRVQALRNCNAFSSTFWQLSRETKLGRRSVRGGLFANREHLRRYVARSVRESAQQEALEI